MGLIVFLHSAHDSFCVASYLFGPVCCPICVYGIYIYINKYIYIYIHTYIVIQMGRIRDEKRRRKKIKKEKV